jgi:putative SOS response-associated peptidase YedK
VTINADDHPLMRLFHKLTDEKRMVMILQDNRYQDWLMAQPEHSTAFMQPMPAEMLLAISPQPPNSPFAK